VGARVFSKGINMSVIGKMCVQSQKTFNNSQYDRGHLLTLGVVCENQFMAHYHPENENVVFTKYSPSGNAEIHFDKEITIPPRLIESNGETREIPGELYLIYLRQADRPNIEKSVFHAPLKCYSRTEYGTDLKTIELTSALYLSSNDIAKEGQPRRISIKLGIDNPCAANQFEPGQTDWWVVAYSANEMSSTEALALAHTSQLP
jgi:hypothetical protein